LKEDRIIADKV